MTRRRVFVPEAPARAAHGEPPAKEVTRLALSRRTGEALVIRAAGGKEVIRVRVLRYEHGQGVLAIEAPPTVGIMREELLDVPRGPSGEDRQ